MEKLYEGLGVMFACLGIFGGIGLFFYIVGKTINNSFKDGED